MSTLTRLGTRPLRALAAAGLIALLMGCGNILKDIEEDVNKKYTLTIEAGAGGSVSPSGAVTVDHGVARAITATADPDYHFLKWDNPSGTGTALEDANAASTTVSLTAGDATVRATFAADAQPEISVKYNSTTYESGSTVTIGSCWAIAQDIVSSFVIENTGDLDLAILTSAVTGTYFSKTKDPQTPLAASGGSSTLEVTYDPQAVGSHSATLVITSDDRDEGTFILFLTAEATDQPVPDIHLRQDLTALPSGTGLHPFGDILADGDGSTASDWVVFTIQNLGSAALTVSSVSFVSGNSADFDLDLSGLASTVAPPSSTQFAIRFDPLTPGSKAVGLRIVSNDADEPNYDISLTGSGISPVADIGVSQDGTSLPDGTGEYGFNDILFDGNDGTSSGYVSFTIANSGTGNLVLGGVTLASGHTGDFDLDTSTLNSTVAPGDTTSFSLRFDPVARGSRQAVVSITSNDPEEDPCTFNVTGTGIASEIQVTESGANINDGGSKDFGTCFTGASIDKTFTILNTGTSILTLSGAPTISGPGYKDFALVTPPATTIAAGGSTTFLVRFRVTWETSSTHTASIDISNNDPDGSENPYNITITASANNFNGWRDVVSLGTDPQVIIDYPNVYVIYQVTTGANGLNFCQSSDGGNSWSAGTVIDSAGSRPAAYYDYTKHYIYVSYYASAGKNVKFARYCTTDASPTWFTTTVVSTNDVGGYHDIVASTYGDPDRTYLCYTDETDLALKCVGSTDNGTTWGTPVVVEDLSSGLIRHCSIACINQSPSYVVISYMVDDTANSLKLAVSSNYGASFGTVTLDTTVSLLCGTAVDCHDWNAGLLAVAYLDSGEDLSVARCTSWLTRWSNPANWSFSAVEASVDVDQYLDIELHDDSPDIFVAYNDTTNDNLKMAYSSSSGSSWTLKTPPQDGSNYGALPSIELWNGVLAIAYSSFGGDVDVSVSDSLGADW